MEEARPGASKGRLPSPCPTPTWLPAGRAALLGQAEGASLWVCGTKGFVASLSDTLAAIYCRSS